MDSVTKLMENKLKLKVNKNKSAVDLVTKRKFLGFSFYYIKGKFKIRIHDKSIKRFKNKIRFITNRNRGISIDERILRLNDSIRGWINYFGIADAKRKLKLLDSWIRRRLRACLWKQWKKTKTKYKNLIKLGISKSQAYQFANTRKGYWRISKSPVLDVALTNGYFKSIGLMSLLNIYQIIN